jgi:predicted permease
MDHLLQDVRFAFRMLFKTPTFTIVAVLTLALGIGANTAIFTLVNAIFFHALPVSTPDRLMSIFTTDQRNRGAFGGALANFLPVSYPNGSDIQHQAQSFSGIAIQTGAPVSMTVNDQPEQFFAQVVSGNFFDVLGVQAALGRTFRPEEDSQPGAGPVIVLNHGFWERKFASNPNVVSQTVLLNGQGFTIIGVAPRGFQGTAVLGGPDMWVPLSMHDQILAGFTKENFNERRFLGFFAIGRLKDGVTEAQASGELQAIGANLQREFPVPNRDRSFVAMPLLQSTINPNLRSLFARAGQLMMTVVGLVLLIACANIANLLLARASGRRREISIRLAMGASRGRIIAQLITEAIVLAIAGGILGIGLAVLARNLIWKFRPAFLQQAALDLSLDSHVLVFTSVIAILTGLIFGLVPALQASHPHLMSELKERAGEDAPTGRRFSIRNAFIVAQVALSLIALIGAGLFLISLSNAQKIDPGFDTTNLAMLSFDVGSLNYDPARAREFQRRALEATQAVPGVKTATIANIVPLFNGGFARSVFPEGSEGSTTRNGILSQLGLVAPDYLQTMGIPLLRGQNFDSSVREESPKVAIINEAAAKRFWPNEDPIGKRFKFFGEKDFVQVIGVARDSKYNSLGEDPTSYMYLPLIQNPSTAVTLFFRCNGDPKSVIPSARSQVQALDRNLPLTNVWPIGEVIDQALFNARFGAALLAVFAGLAVLLCAVGIYGVVGYTVGQRVREFGIRLALGAQPKDVVLMVIRQSARTLAIGLIAGLIAAFVLARLVIDLLYGVGATEPFAFMAMAVMLAAIGILASYIPARHAAAVDPMKALHE